VEDLTDKVGKAEEQMKSENATTQRTTRSAVAAQSDKQLATTLKTLETQTKGMYERLEELESIVDQLNDKSTQPTENELAPNASTKEIKKLNDLILAVEKQLHAAIGAKHKSSIHGDPKDRTPSVHSLFLSIEGFRKRLRSLEEMEGVTKCARFLQQLQVTTVQQRGAITPTVQVRPIPHPVPTQPLETVVEDTETEDEILERQVELTKPA
jgi:hypothetical protein